MAIKMDLGEMVMTISMTCRYKNHNKNSSRMRKIREMVRVPEHNKEKKGHAFVPTCSHSHNLKCISNHSIAYAIPNILAFSKYSVLRLFYLPLFHYVSNKWQHIGQHVEGFE